MSNPTKTLSKESVIDKCNYFSDIGLWPPEVIITPEPWLENFTEAELNFAIALLDSFVYYNHNLVEELFLASYEQIPKDLYKLNRDYKKSLVEWDNLKYNGLFTHVTGEQPSSTDSGHLFSRLARQLIRIEQDNILNPEVCIAELIINKRRPVIFFDDFAGTGNQFWNSWTRKYPTSQGMKSFSDILSGSNNISYYCNIACTEKARNRIEKDCHGVIICSPNFIPNNASVTHAESLVWPDDLREESQSFLLNTSKRAGIPIDKSESGWTGFHGLGLTIAFAHGIPDATIPIFSWDKEGWNPLIRI